MQISSLIKTGIARITLQPPLTILNITCTLLKSYLLILEYVIEGTVSQILYLGPTNKCFRHICKISNYPLSGVADMRLLCGQVQPSVVNTELSTTILLFHQIDRAAPCTISSTAWSLHVPSLPSILLSIPICATTKFNSTALSPRMMVIAISSVLHPCYIHFSWSSPLTAD